MAHFLIKAVLPTSETEFFKSTKDNPSDELIARRIVICNTKGFPVEVFLSFTGKGGHFMRGFVLAGYPVPAYGTIEVTDRIIRSEGKILAYAGAANALVLSIDIEGADGEYAVPEAVEPEAPEVIGTKRFL